MDNKNRKAHLIFFIFQVIISGGLMFVFYYFADKDPLLKASLKALAFGIVISSANVVIDRWLKKKYKSE